MLFYDLHENGIWNWNKMKTFVFLVCHSIADWMMTTHVDLGSLMYNQNCKLGSKESCIQLGGLYLQGLSIFPRDHERAAEAFERACKLGSAKGCYQAGVMRTSEDFQVDTSIID